LQLADFNFTLPEELIAQHPLPRRDGARMLVIDRAKQSWQDHLFAEFSDFVHSDDCLVVNNSRVFPSRLFGELEPGGGKAEIFLLREIEPAVWLCLARPGKRLRVGAAIRFDADLTALVVSTGERGERIVRFVGEGDVTQRLEQIGHVPLPPYIHRGDEPEDRERYQTVFARERGSAAAPTAGLHFTEDVLARVRQEGAVIAPVTLHVGLGTFQPIENPQVEENRLHAERYSVTEDSWSAITAARRVIAAGTTSVRTIETVARTGVLAGETSIFLYPGQKFHRVNALLTNFHLPQSSLLLLVCAFAGSELMLAAYRYAVQQKYRFFSYGDCMLIL
jgi:S-adenosylmethionine:tRNA ribosyltransferase-isomerase